MTLFGVCVDHDACALHFVSHAHARCGY